MTPFKKQILSAIKALGGKATRVNIAKRLKRPVGTVTNVLQILWRDNETVPGFGAGATRVWRVK